MVSVGYSFSLMFSTIDVLCCSRCEKRTRSNVLSKNAGNLLLSKQTSISEAKAASAFVGAEPSQQTGDSKLRSSGCGGSQKLSETELKAVLQHNLALITESRARLKHVEVQERTVRFAEKPDVRMVQAARGRLRSTEIQQRTRLPTVDDIRAEKMATEISHKILKDAKNRLRHVELRPHVGIFTEKPDVNMIHAAQRRLKPTQVRHKMYLPTADDIRAEKAAQAVPEKPAASEIQGAIKRLRHVNPVVKTWNPSAEELVANRADREKNQAAGNAA